MDLGEAKELMSRARNSLSSLERDLAEFAAENRELFAGATTRDDSGGLPHEWHACYERYCKRYDDSLETFIADAGVTRESFADAARTVLAAGDEFSPEKFFLEALLASTDFGYFKTLMIAECAGGGGNHK